MVEINVYSWKSEFILINNETNKGINNDNR